MEIKTIEILSQLELLLLIKREMDQVDIRSICSICFQEQIDGADEDDHLIKIDQGDGPILWSKTSGVDYLHILDKDDPCEYEDQHDEDDEVA